MGREVYGESMTGRCWCFIQSPATIKFSYIASEMGKAKTMTSMKLGHREFMFSDVLDYQNMLSIIC